MGLFVTFPTYAHNYHDHTYSLYNHQFFPAPLSCPLIIVLLLPTLFPLLYVVGKKYLALFLSEFGLFS